MNKKILYGILILTLLAVIGSGFYFFSDSDPGYTQARTIRYSLTVQNITNTPVSNASIRVFGPAKQTSWQLTRNITADADFTLENDEAGNQILHFGIDNLPPHATRIIRIQADLLLAREPQEIIPAYDTSRYLTEEPFIETSNDKLVSLATRLASNQTARLSRNIFDWVSANVQYAGYIRDDRGALYAYEHKKGDCTEYMYLYTALSRINGVPTRGIGGYIISNDTVLKARDYHNWAESYIDKRWRVIDPQNKIHMNYENNYIAFRIFHNKNNPFMNNTHRFSHSDDGLKVTMN